MEGKETELAQAALDDQLARYSQVRRNSARGVLRRTHLIGRGGAIRNPALISLREHAVRLTRHRRFWKQLIFRRMVNVG